MKQSTATGSMGKGGAAQTRTVSVAGTYRDVVRQPAPTRRDAASEVHMGELGRSRFKHQHPMPVGAGATEPLVDTAEMQEQQFPESVGEPREKSLTSQTSTTSGMVDVECQTLYRESEAQTEPFSPEFVVAPGERPEVLRLAELGFRWGRGLPAGVEDIDDFEWQRQRDALAATAHAEPDAIRRKHVEAQLREMDAKRHEAAIDTANAARVQALRDAMAGLDEQVRDRADRRVKAIVDRSDASRERALEQARRRRLRSLRRLEDERKSLLTSTSSKPLSSTTTSDVIHEFGDAASRTLAPLDRDGARAPGPVANAEPELAAARRNAILSSSTSAVSTALIARAAEINDEAASLVPQQRAGAGRRVGGGTESATREAARKKAAEEETIRMAESVRLAAAAADRSLAMPLRHSSARPSLGQLGLSCAQKVVRPSARPATPSVQDVVASQADEKAIAAAVLLQRLIRGRAVQNEMSAGLARRRELIQELVSSVPAAVVSVTAPTNTTAADAVALKAGIAIGRALDFYAKQLTRQRDHARLLAMAEAAARQREDREAAERHRRDVEVEQLHCTEQAYAEVMESCTATADFVLADVFGESVERTAARQALAFANAYQPNVEPIPEGQVGKAVRGLLETFLWPTVEKASRARQKEQDDCKYDLAARLSLQSITC